MILDFGPLRTPNDGLGSVRILATDVIPDAA
jgi:hypothetical protein